MGYCFALRLWRLDTFRLVGSRNERSCLYKTLSSIPGGFVMARGKTRTIAAPGDMDRLIGCIHLLGFKAILITPFKGGWAAAGFGIMTATAGVVAKNTAYTIWNRQIFIEFLSRCCRGAISSCPLRSICVPGWEKNETDC